MASAQPALEEICLDPVDARKALRCLMEAGIKDEKISLLEREVEVLRREKEIANQEAEYQKRLVDLAQRETAVYKLAYEREKDLTERALKLAEVGRPKSDWQLQGALALGAILLGVIIGK